MKNFAKAVYRRMVPLVPDSFIAPERYVLISGCPRSGTSACLQWMDNHPRTVTFYENRIAYALSTFCDTVDRYQKLANRANFLQGQIRSLFLRDAADQKWTRGRVLVLKEPVQATAFEHVDQLAMLMNLKRLLTPLSIVLLTRHPVNVVNSMLNRKWGTSIVGAEPQEMSVERGVAAWKNAADMSQAFKDDDSVLDIRFEDFLEESERTAASIAAATGLSGTFNVELRRIARVSLTDEQIDYVLEQTENERTSFGYNEQSVADFRRTLAETES